jgi:hypothetical protein
MKWCSKKYTVLAAVLLAFAVVLAWPVANWLEYREKHFNGRQTPHAVYLVAGSIDQDRRIEALVNFSSCLPNDSTATNSGLIVLVGNDRLKSRWSSEEQANLTRAEWGVKNIRKKLSSKGVAAEVEIVPGIFGGTDGEMDALGQYLAGNNAINNIVLVTSSFHVRRTLRRFAVYQPREMEISVVVSKAKWTDRAPWTVLGELFKIGRDAFWLSRAPLLSRRIS